MFCRTPRRNRTQRRSFGRWTGALMLTGSKRQSIKNVKHLQASNDSESWTWLGLHVWEKCGDYWCGQVVAMGKAHKILRLFSWNLGLGFKVWASASPKWCFKKDCFFLCEINRAIDTFAKDSRLPDEPPSSQPRVWNKVLAPGSVNASLPKGPKPPEKQTFSDYFHDF